MGGKKALSLLDLTVTGSVVQRALQTDQGNGNHRMGNPRKLVETRSTYQKGHYQMEGGARGLQGGMKEEALVLGWHHAEYRSPPGLYVGNCV